MSQDFFRIERGLELDETVQMLQGSGAPGAAGDTAAAPVGSTYQDNADGSLYTKIASGTGTAKWQKMASEKYVNDAVGSTVSWREPVVVRDNVATTLPTGTASSPIVIDGASVTDGQRVLFSAISGGNGKNIYVYNQATGLFVEDINAESTGDATYVQGGTSAGKTFVYNGSAWVLTDQTSLDEEGYIRAFIGKNASGVDMPAFASNNFVVDGTDLETAISDLDAEIGANVSLGSYITPANKVNANIQALDNEIGANVAAGSNVSPANTVNQNIQALDTHLGANLALGNFITAGQTATSAITAVDAEIGANVVDGNFVLAASKVNANIQAIDAEIGANVITGSYVSSTNKMNANIQALDTALAATALQTSVTNVTSVQTIDSVTGALSAKWLVRVVNASDSTNVYSTEVYAVSNGVSADYTRYATLKIGGNIVGLAVTVDLSAGALRLRVASTGAVNVSARRVGVVA
jgi:hypothetical protein